MNIGLVFTATNKYIQYIQPLITSADKFFLKNHNVNYYLFTDSVNIPALSNRSINVFYVGHKPFPFASMNRFKYLYENSVSLKNENYLFQIDVDTKIVSEIGNEILGNLVGVRHCGYTNGGGTFETRENSTSFVPIELRKTYFGGGFFGGKTQEVFNLANFCSRALDRDVFSGIMPVWHDESILNRYFAYNQPDIVLSPEYHFPEDNQERYRKIWGNEGKNWKPKILLLTKNHNEVRNA